MRSDSYPLPSDPLGRWPTLGPETGLLESPSPLEPGTGWGRWAWPRGEVGEQKRGWGILRDPSPASPLLSLPFPSFLL